MRRTLVSVALAMLLPWAAQAMAPNAVARADVDRYVGTWYEIARLPNDVEQGCVRDAMSLYERRSEAAIRITYVCRNAAGEEERHQAVARIRETRSQAKLELRFAPLALAWWPFVWDDVWLLEIAPEYSYMMAGDPSGQTLWIYSRTPTLDPSVYAMLVAHAAAQGYDTSKLIRGAHSPR